MDCPKCLLEGKNVPLANPSLPLRNTSCLSGLQPTKNLTCSRHGKVFLYEIQGEESLFVFLEDKPKGTTLPNFAQKERLKKTCEKCGKRTFKIEHLVLTGADSAQPPRETRKCLSCKQLDYLR